LILIVIAFSGIVGGIPYLILTVALLIWMRDKELPSIRRAILLSPLMMIPIYAFCLGVYVLIFERDPSLGEYFIGLFFYGAFIPIFGYAYVGVAFGLEKLLRAE
jgi:amino acid transporter